MPKLLVCGPRDKKVANSHVINTTSRSGDIGQHFSPFLLGPVEILLPEKKRTISKNFENAWQFCKVYPQHADGNGDPTEEWLEWAKSGWKDKWAHRYPMGKGAKPLYSYWSGQKLDYIDARKRIYLNLYTQLIKRSPYLPALVREVERSFRLGENVVLWDYDGYNADAKYLDFDDVLNDASRPMGHAFILREIVMQIIDGEEKTWH